MHAKHKMQLKIENANMKLNKRNPNSDKKLNAQPKNCSNEP